MANNIHNINKVCSYSGSKCKLYSDCPCCISLSKGSSGYKVYIRHSYLLKALEEWYIGTTIMQIDSVVRPMHIHVWYSCGMLIRRLFGLLYTLDVFPREIISYYCCAKKASDINGYEDVFTVFTLETFDIMMNIKL